MYQMENNRWLFSIRCCWR